LVQLPQVDGIVFDDEGCAIYHAIKAAQRDTRIVDTCKDGMRDVASSVEPNAKGVPRLIASQSRSMLERQTTLRLEWRDLGHIQCRSDTSSALRGIGSTVDCQVADRC
jgi:hypothetical protein